MKNENQLLPKHKAKTVLVTGSIACLGGAVMLLMWHLHRPNLFSLNITPMSYGTALGFFLSGLGFLFLWRGHKTASRILGALLLCLSLTALCLYLLGNKASLDSFFKQLGIIGGQTYIVPITAPQTALCFVLVSLVLIMGLQALLTGVFGAFVFGLGLVTTTGYLVSWGSVQDWGLLSQMSLSTAISFSVLGAGLVRLSWLEERVIRTKEYLQINKQLAAEVQERKQTEEALEQSEQHYHAFLQAIPDVMFRVHSDGTFLDYWVPESSGFGQSSGAFIGMPIESFMPGSLTRRMLEQLQKTLESSRIQTFEFQWPSGGEILTYEARVTQSGEQECIFIIRDITEQLRLSEALGKKNQDLEALLYIVSHDLQEPLRAIKSFSRILSRSYLDSMDEKGADFLIRIGQATDRLEQLLDDLLQYSRAQRFELDVVKMSSEVLVNKACERLKNIIQEKGATVTIAPDLLEIHANPTWSIQAIYNLIGNALKYTEPGQAPNIEIDRYQQVKPGGMVDRGLVVRDRGIGVPKEYEEYVFKLFQRAAGRAYQGTGAGLAIVRQIAQRHGGNAWVQAREGGGSEFFITFGVRSLLPAGPNILSHHPKNTTKGVDL